MAGSRPGVQPGAAVLGVGASAVFAGDAGAPRRGGGGRGGGRGGPAAFRPRERPGPRRGGDGVGPAPAPPTGNGGSRPLGPRLRGALGRGARSGPRKPGRGAAAVPGGADGGSSPGPPPRTPWAPAAGHPDTQGPPARRSHSVGRGSFSWGNTKQNSRWEVFSCGQSNGFAYERKIIITTRITGMLMTVILSNEF